MFGICNLAIVPMRFEPSDKSEMISQLLFGEHFFILEQLPKWTLIKSTFDNYEGWICNKQFQEISENEFEKLNKDSLVLSNELIEFVSNDKNELTHIPLGSCLQFLNYEQINTQNYIFDGLKISGKKSKKSIVKIALMYLNAPYLWGGKTPFGIDCSGFTQMVYKLNGYKILRDASQQATLGQALSFIEESEPGDLAFFDNAEGNIIHVGIILENNYIIHASGFVRIDRLDHLGIFNSQLNKHTHQLRVIKKII